MLPFFFHGRNLFVLRGKAAKKGVLAPFSANFFLKKTWSEDNNYKFLKIAFPPTGSPNCNFRQSV